MDSEFYNIELDRLRYSLVWEDSYTIFHHGLPCQPEDHWLIITSAGCNVLNALLTPASRITAIDLNPIQNQLLLFKIHLINYYDYDTYSKILGLQGAKAVKESFSKIQNDLNPAMRSFWQSFFEAHPQGLLGAGRLEMYLNNFISTLPECFGQYIKELCHFENLQEQSNYFQKYVNVPAFKKAFTTYFNEANLSKGRAPQLFKYAQQKAGEAFYERLAYHCQNVFLRDNFYFHFLFFGPSFLPENLLPACYKQKNFDALKKNLSKIENIIEGEAIEFLLSDRAKSVTKASLSNIFEYASHHEFQKVCQGLKNTGRSFSFIYWNLLQHQEPVENKYFQVKKISLPATACFYFKDICIVSI